MKRILILLLVVLSIVSITGCKTYSQADTDVKINNQKIINKYEDDIMRMSSDINDDVNKFMVRFSTPKNYDEDYMRDEYYKLDDKLVDLQVKANTDISKQCYKLTDEQSSQIKDTQNKIINYKDAVKKSLENFMDMVNHSMKYEKGFVTEKEIEKFHKDNKEMSRARSEMSSSMTKLSHSMNNFDKATEGTFDFKPKKTNKEIK